jgi:hypothetical protein
MVTLSMNDERGAPAPAEVAVASTRSTATAMAH